MTKSESFVEYLHKLDRGAYAMLRRSLRDGPGEHPQVYRYVEPFLASHEDGKEPSRNEREAYYLTAGLYSLKEKAGEPIAGVPKDRRFDLGASIGRLYLTRDKSPSIEKRFITLLDADRDQIPYRLRQMVTLLASEQIPIDWAQLVVDLIYWNTSKSSVQRSWARSFYRADATSESVPEGSSA